MTKGTRMPSPSSEARPSFSAVFSKTPTSALTNEEECMLKTALAVVVVKQRRKSLFQQAKKKNGQNQASRVPTQDQGLLDRLFVQNPPPPNRSSLLLLSHRHHLDRIFQAALNMSSHHNTHNNLANDPRLDIFHGTCSHLASQLQTWLQESEGEDEKEENGKAPNSQEEEEADDNRLPEQKGSSSRGESINWIRQSLMTTPYRATFQVYYHVLQFGNPRLNGVILNILLQLLLETYHDQLVLMMPSGTKHAHANRKAPPAYSSTSTTSSNGSKISMSLDKKHNKDNIDWLAVSWLRLTHRCVQFLSPAQLHSILNHNSSNLAHLLLPLELASGNNKNRATNTSNTPTTLIQTFWGMSSTVPSAKAGISPFRTSNSNNNSLTPPARLGTGAKLLLRLGLYRLLYCTVSSGQEFQNDGSVARQH